MKRKAKAIREGIKDISDLLYCVKTNELCDTFYRYSNTLTFDIIAATVNPQKVYPTEANFIYPVSMGEYHKEIDTVSFIRRQMLYIN